MPRSLTSTCDRPFDGENKRRSRRSLAAVAGSPLWPSHQSDSGLEPRHRWIGVIFPGNWHYFLETPFDNPFHDPPADPLRSLRSRSLSSVGAWLFMAVYLQNVLVHSLLHTEKVRYKQFNANKISGRPPDFLSAWRCLHPGGSAIFFCHQDSVIILNET